MAFSDYAPKDPKTKKKSFKKKSKKKGPPPAKGKGNPFTKKKSGGTGMENVLASHIEKGKFGKKKR